MRGLRLALARFGLSIGAPLLVLAVAEMALRLSGVGYPTRYLIPADVEGASVLVDNPDFGRRFFPAGMLRQPPPIVVRQAKAAGTFRILLFGESAALGDPQPAFGVARYLEVLLGERYRGTAFEVIPLAMTAVNTHALLPMARDATRLKADLWIVYAGNNEMLGPFGAGTALGRHAPPAWLVRAILAVKSLRVGQALEGLIEKWRGTGAGSTRWEGLRLFSGQSVPEGSPERARVYANFEDNLRRMVRLGQRSGAAVVLAPVAVNVRDCAPFGSSHESAPAASAGADPQVWERSVQEGIKRLAAGDAGSARSFLIEAERLAPADAGVQFLLGTIDLALTNRPAAAPRMVRARDLDTVPLRTDSRLQELTRRVARVTGATLCDAPVVLSAQAPQGLPGNEFFYEHVHLTPEGNYALALGMAETVTGLLPESVRQGAIPEWPTAGWCDGRLALSPWNRHDAVELMLRRCAGPPFTHQLNHDQHLRELAGQAARWRAMETAEAARDAKAAYAQAIDRSPGDPHLCRSHAEFLDATGALESAIAEWRRLAQLLPQHFRGWYQAGAGLIRAGRPEEAIPLLQRVVALQPEWPQGYVELGRALFQHRDVAGALAQCDRALELDPNLALAHRYRADALAALGRRSEGLASLEEAVRLDPGYAEARYLLGVEYAVLNRIADAETQLTEVVRLQPGNVRARFNLAVALARQSRWQEAAEAFEQTLRLDPQHAEARRMLSQIAGLARRVISTNSPPADPPNPGP